jgi:hypothetical protein
MSDLEQDLIEQGYMLIHSRFDGTCTRCGERYYEGTVIYWKKEGDRTLVVCPRCYGGEDQVYNGQVTCPHCGKTFNITAHSK